MYRRLACAERYVIVFKDDSGVITGLAIDDFPEVQFREQVVPDV